jgi:hypothetical protein
VLEYNKINNVHPASHIKDLFAYTPLYTRSWIVISMKINWFLRKLIKPVWTDFVGSLKIAQFDLIFLNFEKLKQKNWVINQKT